MLHFVETGVKTCLCVVFLVSRSAVQSHEVITNICYFNNDTCNWASSSAFSSPGEEWKWTRNDAPPPEILSHREGHNFMWYSTKKSGREQASIFTYISAQPTDFLNIKIFAKSPNMIPSTALQINLYLLAQESKNCTMESGNAAIGYVSETNNNWIQYRHMLQELKCLSEPASCTCLCEVYIVGIVGDKEDIVAIDNFSIRAQRTTSPPTTTEVNPTASIDDFTTGSVHETLTDFSTPEVPSTFSSIPTERATPQFSNTPTEDDQTQGTATDLLTPEVPSTFSSIPTERATPQFSNPTTENTQTDFLDFLTSTISNLSMSTHQSEIPVSSSTTDPLNTTSTKFNSTETDPPMTMTTDGPSSNQNSSPNRSAIILAVTLSVIALAIFFISCILVIRRRARVHKMDEIELILP